MPITSFRCSSGPPCFLLTLYTLWCTAWGLLTKKETFHKVEEQRKRLCCCSLSLSPWLNSNFSVWGCTLILNWKGCKAPSHNWGVSKVELGWHSFHPLYFLFHSSEDLQESKGSSQKRQQQRGNEKKKRKKNQNWFCLNTDNWATNIIHYF